MPTDDATEGEEVWEAPNLLEFYWTHTQLADCLCVLLQQSFSKVQFKLQYLQVRGKQ